MPFNNPFGALGGIRDALPAGPTRAAHEKKITARGVKKVTLG